MARPVVHESTLQAATFVVTAVVQFALLLVINNHDWWRPLLGGIVTARFADTLWAINLVSVVQILASLLLSVWRPARLQRVLDIITAALSCVSGLVTWQVFPFEVLRFGPWAPIALRALVALGIAATVLAVLVNLGKLVSLAFPLNPDRPASHGEPPAHAH
jgi:hypothetical protein